MINGECSTTDLLVFVDLGEVVPHPFLEVEPEHVVKFGPASEQKRVRVERLSAGAGERTRPTRWERSA